MPDRLLEYFMPFLMIAIYATVTGIAVNKLSLWLDNALSFQGIFWKFRYWVVQLRLKNKQAFNVVLGAYKTTFPGGEITESEYYDNIYNEYCPFWSRWILCPECIGTRILIVGSFAFVLVMGLPIYMAALFFFLSFIGFKI